MLAVNRLIPRLWHKANPLARRYDLYSQTLHCYLILILVFGKTQGRTFDESLRNLQTTQPMNNQQSLPLAKTFSRFLKENRLYHPYQRAVKHLNKYVNNWESLFRYCNNPRFLISNAFPWYRTNEGYDFWRRVDDRWRNIANHYLSQK